LPKIDEEYIKSSKVQYVVRHLQLESIHPQAFKAAEPSHCANDQGKYWEYHSRLFANQRALNRPDLTAHAQALGLNVAAFDQCVDSGKYAARIRKDVGEAERLGVSATPTFLVGLLDKGQLKSVRVIRGAVPFESMKSSIDELLSGK